MRTRTSLLPAALVAAILLPACSNPGDDAGAAAPAAALPSSRPDDGLGGAGPAAATEAVVAAAEAFLVALTEEQRDQVLYEATDPALRQWIYFPTTSDRNGLMFGDMSDQQRAAALGVAEAVLSGTGYDQLRGVVAAEDALGVRNNTDVGSGQYHIALFGRPSATERFTVQINGHHLAVNTTFENDRVSPTPAFTGVDPVDFELNGERLRPMLTETEAVSGLLGSMDEGELAAARIEPIDDVRVGNGDDDQYPQAEGTLVTELSAEQRDRVTAAVRAWVGDTDERVAEVLTAQYEAEYDRTRIAWSGSTDPDTPGSYLRIDGPRLWIEFSNVGRFGNGDNHHHSVYRDKPLDYLGTSAG